jgi:hypothetical protein
LAKERAISHASEGQWLEASQFLGIANILWEDSPELQGLRAEVEIQLNDLYIAELDARRSLGVGSAERGAGLSGLPGQKDPVNATEAITLARQAFDERKYIDAHWYATVGSRLAREGSPERTEAARLASLAWNQVESQRPGARETAAFMRYQLKASGYQAVLAGDWIRAYYIFKQLDDTTTGVHDPDVENFLALSEKGTKEIAFFIDEEELSVGGTLTGVIFSLPRPEGVGRAQGRAVLRIGGFSSTPDYAYGIDLEYMVFDSLSRQLLSLQVPYAKFLPITLDGQQRVLVLMRALDRRDPNIRREPTFAARDETVYRPEQAQVILNVSYETFLMLSRMRQGLPGFQFRELFDAGRVAADYGYISQVFEAEVLNRLGSCLFFLPMAVIVVLLGLRLRTKTRSHFISVLMLPVLPVVFNGLTHLYRSVFNTIGISLILEVGFSSALTLFIIILVFFFIISLILLTSHRD